MATDMKVANTILAQMGGGRFIAMTGAKNLTGSKNTLMFSIPKKAGKPNKVVIELKPDDTYDVGFWNIARGGLSTKRVGHHTNIYADQLRDVFTRGTGLETSLGTLGQKRRRRTRM